MKRLLKNIAFILITVNFLTACSETGKRATENLNDLNERTEELNTAIDNGLNSIESLDSVVRSGAEQIKEYDSLVTRSTSKIDSIAKEKARAWEELTTF